MYVQTSISTCMQNVYMCEGGGGVMVSIFASRHGAHGVLSSFHYGVLGGFLRSLVGSQMFLVSAG